MRTQEIFDIAYSVSLAGLENEHQLVRAFFMRSGVHLPYSEIVDLYQEIVRVVNTMGYSDPLDFIKDFFPEENFRKIRIFRKNAGKKIKLEKIPTQQLVTTTENKQESNTFQTAVEEPKRIKVQSPKSEIIEKETVLRPIKIKKGVFEKEEDITSDISIKDRNRTMKYKKVSRRFKEMDQKKKR